MGKPEMIFLRIKNDIIRTIFLNWESILLECNKNGSH